MYKFLKFFAFIALSTLIINCKKDTSPSNNQLFIALDLIDSSYVTGSKITGIQADSLKRCCFSDFSSEDKAYYYFIKSQDYYYRDINDSTDIFFFKADSINALEKIHPKIKMKILALKGLKTANEGDVGNGLKLLLKALAIADSIDYENISVLYYRIGRTYFQAKDIDKAKKYLELSNQAIKDTNSNKIIFNYNAAAAMAAQEQKFDEAIAYTMKAKNKSEQIKDKKSLTNSLRTMGMIYLYKKEYSNALPYLFSAKEIAEKNDFKSDLSQILEHLFVVYFNQNDLSKAEYYINKSHEFNRGLTSESVYYQNLEQIRTKQKRYDKALLYHLKSDSLRNVMQGTEVRNKMEELEKKYNISKKEKEILILNQNIKNKEQDAKFKNGLLLFLTSILLLGGLIAWLLFRQRNIQAEADKIALEQRLLLSQMNPHFMFNALSAIQSEIIMGNTKMANLYLTKYAELTRLILENSTLQNIPLVNEVKILENYLLLQKVRFEEKFDYQITVFDNYQNENVEIPPMLLQPFVENAIEHAFREIDYKGFIKIDIQRNNEQLLCTIEDNGIGLGNVQNNKKKSLSIQIAKERLKHLSASKLEIIDKKIVDKQQKGVKVALQIPVL